MSSWTQYNHLGNTDTVTATLRLSWLNIVWYNPVVFFELRRKNRTLTAENQGELGYQLGHTKRRLVLREWLYIVTRRTTHLVGLFTFSCTSPNPRSNKMPPKSGRDQFPTQLSDKAAS